MAAKWPRAEMLSVGVALDPLRTQGKEFSIFRGSPGEVSGFGNIFSRHSIATPWRMCSTCPHWIRIAFGIEAAIALGISATRSRGWRVLVTLGGASSICPANKRNYCFTPFDLVVGGGIPMGTGEWKGLPTVSPARILRNAISPYRRGAHAASATNSRGRRAVVLRRERGLHRGRSLNGRNMHLRVTIVTNRSSCLIHKGSRRGQFGVGGTQIQISPREGPGLSGSGTSRVPECAVQSKRWWREP